MAERSKALRSGRSLVLQAWVRIPLLTTIFVMLYTTRCDQGNLLLCHLLQINGNVAVRTAGSQSREPGFDCSGCCFEAMATSFSLCCHN